MVTAKLCIIAQSWNVEHSKTVADVSIWSDPIHILYLWGTLDFKIHPKSSFSVSFTELHTDPRLFVQLSDKCEINLKVDLFILFAILVKKMIFGIETKRIDKPKTGYEGCCHLQGRGKKVRQPSLEKDFVIVKCQRRSHSSSDCSWLIFKFMKE